MQIQIIGWRVRQRVHELHLGFVSPGSTVMSPTAAYLAACLAVQFFLSTDPACRLVNGMTWDRLLSTVSTLFFSYKRLCGTWSLGLGLAVARRQGTRKMSMSEQEPGTGGDGYSVVWVPGDAYAAARPDGLKKCPAACGACLVCLMAEQVTAPGCTMVQGCISHTLSQCAVQRVTVMGHESVHCTYCHGKLCAMLGEPADIGNVLL